jgi:hypothetical protein
VLAYARAMVEEKLGISDPWLATFRADFDPGAS